MLNLCQRGIYPERVFLIGQFPLAGTCQWQRSLCDPQPSEKIQATFIGQELFVSLALPWNTHTKLFMPKSPPDKVNVFHPIASTWHLSFLPLWLNDQLSMIIIIGANLFLERTSFQFPFETYFAIIRYCNIWLLA